MNHSAVLYKYDMLLFLLLGQKQLKEGRNSFGIQLERVP